tara:strand:+ start:20698 stop:21777 length:1080 start_codon:yes stop_codon:yes gene_type:complete
MANFFEQQQSSLRSGIDLGQAMQKYDMNKQNSALRQQQEDRQQQEFSSNQERNAFDFKETKNKAVLKNLLQDSVILTSLDKEAQDKMFPALARKYQGVEGFGKVLKNMESKSQKERNSRLFQFIGAMKDQSTTQPDKQFGAQKTFRDGNGNLFFGTTERDPRGGMKSILAAVDGSDSKPVGGVDLVSDLGQTADEKGGLQAKVAGRKSALSQAIAQGAAAFQALPTISANIGRYDEAMGYLDDGARTGPVINMLPSFSEASVNLATLQRELGLDVVQMTTFGALSEGELKLALNVGLPTSKDPESLKKWLVDKKAAQEKVYANLMEIATALSGGNMTIEEFIKSKKGGQQATEINWGDI